MTTLVDPAGAEPSRKRKCVLFPKPPCPGAEVAGTPPTVTDSMLSPPWSRF
jgi:hypothetical protein